MQLPPRSFVRSLPPLARPFRATLAVPLPAPPAAGDWLQGPHVYRLYDFYGFDMGQIGKLFIAGFGSSMVFGTVVGALADKQYVPAAANDCWPACWALRLLTFETRAAGVLCFTGAAHLRAGCTFAPPHRRPAQPPLNCRLHPPLPPPTRSGRKRAAITYCVTYTLGCLTKHFNNFWVLCGGRVLCGIATSLLFSAFESWLVSEHFKVNATPIELLLLRRGCVCCCNEPQLAVGPGRRRPYCTAAFERCARVAAGASAPTCWARPFPGVHASGHPSLPPACNACLSGPSADVLTLPTALTFGHRSAATLPTGWAAPSARPCSWATA